MTNSYIIQSKKANGDSGDEALTHAQMDINLGFLVPTGFILPYAGKLSTTQNHTNQFTYLNSTHTNDKAIHRLPGDATTQLAWLFCDGSAVSKADYSALFDRIGHVYSGADLVQNAGGYDKFFCVPDLRGQFIRGWDNGSGTDPNAGSRTASGNLTLSGVVQFTANDNPGTKQANENKSHIHGFKASSKSGDEASWLSTNDRGFSGQDESVSNYDGTNKIFSSGGSESRPTNIALAYFIKT